MMKETQVTVSLFCIHCREEVDHTICYLNNKISQITCNVCGKSLEIKIDITREIFEEWVERLKSKPLRMNEEIRGHMIEFLLSFPFRVTSKPYRIYKEMKEVKGYYQKYKIKKKI